MSLCKGSDNRGGWIALLFLAVLSGTLRFHDLGHLGFYYDEAENALVARNYLETGTFTLPSGHPARNGMTYKWVVAQLFGHFGESETLNRVPAAAAGVLTTLLVYVIGRCGFSSIVGLVAAFLYAVWPWSVTWGRIGRFYNFQQLLFVPIVLTFWWLLEIHLRNAGESPVSLLKRLALPFLTLMGLTLLSLLTSFTTFHSLFFIPVYLGLLLGSFRGDRTPSRRRVLTAYLIAGGLVLGAAAGGLYLLDSDYVKTILRNSRSLELIPGYYIGFVRNNFGLAFSLLAIVGWGMGFYRGRFGLLLVSTLTGPWLVHTFAVTYYRPRFLYYLFPFLCLAVALPVGWAIERAVRFVHEKEYRMSGFGPGPVLALVTLLLFGQTSVKNLFLSELSTRNILMGKPQTFAREVPGFREAAEKVLPLEEGTRVITTDPVLSSYYLGRSDAVFPFVLPSQHPKHYNMETPGLTPESFLDLISGATRPVVLIGTVRKIDGVLERPEMAEVKRVLEEEAEETWETEGARLYRW